MRFFHPKLVGLLRISWSDAIGQFWLTHRRNVWKTFIIVTSTHQQCICNCIHILGTYFKIFLICIMMYFNGKVIWLICWWFDVTISRFFGVHFQSQFLHQNRLQICENSSIKKCTGWPSNWFFQMKIIRQIEGRYSY